MNFLKKLFGGSKGDDNRMLPIYVMSHRCREPIEGKVDLFNELSGSDEGKGYYVRKVLHTSGQNRCFDQVEVEIWFNGNKEIAEQTVSGGRWLTAAEFADELARFNAPPEEDEETAAEPVEDRVTQEPVAEDPVTNAGDQADPATGIDVKDTDNPSSGNRTG